MLTIIHGKESLRSRLYLQDLLSALSVERFDAAYDAWPRVRSALEGTSLFGDARTIVLEGALSDKTFAEQLASWGGMASLSSAPHTHLILFEGEDVSTRALFKKIAPHARVEHFLPSDGKSAVAWLQKQLGANEAMPAAIVKEVFARCNQDMWCAYNELGKIAAFCGTRTPTMQDVERLDTSSAQAHIFSTIDAIFSKRSDEALERMQRHWAAGESPLALFAMIERQLRIVALVRDALDSGTHSSRAIAQELKLHPFVVQKALATAQRLSLANIKELYARVESLDEKAKKGEIDPYLACELLASAVLA